MHEQTRDPLYSQKEFKEDGSHIPEEEGGELMKSIIKFRNRGMLSLTEKEARVTCFILDLEDALQIPHSHAKKIKKMARDLYR